MGFLRATGKILTPTVSGIVGDIFSTGEEFAYLQGGVIMERLESNQDWLNDILPEGLPYPTSNIISGPGGTGQIIEI